MSAKFRLNLRAVLAAAIVALLSFSGTALATHRGHDAANADRVDGRHAVGAKASIDKRAKKLVATKKNGRLPNNIILKAPNADRLDGTTSTGFLRAGATAVNANQLDGIDSTGFLGANETAADSDMLGGQLPNAYASAGHTHGLLGYATYSIVGTKVLGSANMGDAVWDAADEDYSIVIQDVDFHPLTSTVLVTHACGTPRMAGITGSGGELVVAMQDAAANGYQCIFSVLVYGEP